jgi:hypothetical protein
MKTKRYSRLIVAIQLCSAGILSAAYTVTDTDILAASVSTQVSSNHLNATGDGASYPGTALTNGTMPLAIEIGTISDTTEWASYSVNNGVGWVVLDMGSSQSYAGMLYAQRGGSGVATNADVWHKTDIWVSDTNPGDPGGWGLAQPAPAGTLIADDMVLDRRSGTLVQYDFDNTYTGQYLIYKFSMYDDAADTNKVTLYQPGGRDLWMFVPEPSATLLGGFGLLALLRRRRNA